MQATIHSGPESVESALQRWRRHEGRPLLLSDWTEAVFLHYEIDARTLQRVVPFPLDLREGKAWVSVVAFTMRRLRFARGGTFSEWACLPVATQHFLNLRTYVCPGGDSGIFFLAEWLSSRLGVALGPLLYGLPYRHGRHDYRRAPEHGRVAAEQGTFAYKSVDAGGPTADLAPCEPGSVDEFLLERYSAFTRHLGRNRMFRIWHEPWLQRRIEIDRRDESLLTGAMPWWPETRFVAANYSPGAHGIWMGRPRSLMVAA